MINDIKHPFMILFEMHISSLVGCLSKSFAHFLFPWVLRNLNIFWIQDNEYNLKHFLPVYNLSFSYLSIVLEEEMATHSGVLAWRIPGTGESGGLLSMGSHRVGHDWSDLAAAAALFFKEKFLILIKSNLLSCFIWTMFLIS